LKAVPILNFLNVKLGTKRRKIREDQQPYSVDENF